MDQRSSMPERRLQTAPSAAPMNGASAVRLVEERKLALDLGADGGPAEWAQALAALAASHRIALEPAHLPRSSALFQVARWAAGSELSRPAPVFAPWQACAPAVLQNPLARNALPQAQWQAGYLFDPVALRSGAAASLDVMLASPLPAACLDEDACHTALPRKAVLDAMLAAVRAEQRERLAIIVPARSRSAMAQRLLGAARTLTQGEIAIEIIAIEDAIARLMRSAAAWDAIIVLPELRGIIAAVLAEISGVAGPWPLLWFENGLVRVTAEALRESPQVLPLDAAVLMQALALAAHHAGLSFAARRLGDSWARLRDSGVETPSRRSHSPYANQVDEAGFLALAIGDHALAAGRPVPDWKALGQPEGNQRLRSPVALTLVRP